MTIMNEKETIFKQEEERRSYLKIRRRE